jgi:CheY-like chemotaxis protein/anti-sigma regulatory factor (Ser/Thr protein kinase)
MPKVLIVDDSAVDRRLAGGLLEKRVGITAAEKRTGITNLFAVNGKEALALMERELPDVVLTDMQMPEMTGLELVEAIKARFPAVPVILMTAHGSEETAIEALRLGAASYVPKKNLAKDLLETVEEMLTVAGAQRQKQRLIDECWKLTETHFILPSNLAYITPLIGHLQENLTRMKLCDENDLIRVAVCLREAMSNAIIHGNLQISSALRESNEREYYDLIEERSEQEPYDNRRVFVTARETCDEAMYIIRDEGPGFNPMDLPDPTDPANIEKGSGRGLLLIRTFMDEVRHSKTANEITMFKRRSTAESA